MTACAFRKSAAFISHDVSPFLPSPAPVALPKVTESAHFQRLFHGAGGAWPNASSKSKVSLHVQAGWQAHRLLVILRCMLAHKSALP